MLGIGVATRIRRTACMLTASPRPPPGVLGSVRNEFEARIAMTDWLPVLT
jgi:hypothetical protein